MPISFVEKAKLSKGNDLVMTYRGQMAGHDFFAYILCTEEGVKLMHSDYEDSISRQLEEYGEVIYTAAGSDPDEKALEFLKSYLAENNGSLV